MKSLYHITAEQARLNDAIEAAEGELSPELEEALHINASELEARAEDYAASILDAEANVAAIRTEEERLGKLRKSYVRRADVLRRRLAEAFVALDVRHLGAGKYALSVRPSTAVHIDDEAALPEQFVVTKTTRTPDRKLIAQTIKGGEDVPGARLEVRKNLQIK